METLKLKFEVGDWVVGIQDGALYKIKEIKEFPEESTYKRFIFSSTEETWIDIYNDEVDTDGWELWQPITGEWCWYSKWDKIVCVEFYLCKFILDMKEVEPEFKHRYEPFIGQLPTFLES